MSLNSAMNTAATGLSAERFRMDVISVNIANANSTRSGTGPAGDPYRRREVVLKGGSEGPTIQAVLQDPRPFNKKLDPANPYHDEKGFVDVTNVEPITEMVDMLTASRSYEANVAAFNTARGMIKSALNIGKV